MKQRNADLSTHAWTAGALLLSACLASADPAAGPTPDSAPVSPTGATNAPASLDLQLNDAVLMALSNNRELIVERLKPKIQRTSEQLQRAAFDPVLAGNITAGQAHPKPVTTDNETRTVGGSLKLQKALPTGTKLDASVGTQRETGVGEKTNYATRAEIGATQALLQGRPAAVNLASLRQARLDTEISEYELRGFAETLVAEVESAYWECALARRNLDIFEKSMAIAEQQKQEVEQKIRVGSLPETELAAALAEVALRREALINARSKVSTTQLRLLRLVDPDALRKPRRDLRLATVPAAPEVKLDPIPSHVAVALRMRCDMNEARLKLQKGNLELVKTRNGLLPRLDLFIRLGKTGYADSFGDSASEIDGKNLDASAGLSLEYPFHNRGAEARHRRARFSHEQDTEALKNMEDLVRVEVESGYLEVERAREQVDATATTRKLQEEKAKTEAAKFAVGRSTALLVAQAQRDVLSSQVAEAEAVIRHLEAVTSLFRLEGSLLERRGIQAPGKTPPAAPAPSEAR